MKTSCRLEIDLKDKKTAERVLKSIKVDDYNFVESKLEGNMLIAEIKSNSVSSLLHTVDDYLACVSVAEKVISN